MSADGWRLFGLAGQALFFSRFVVQWVVSERRGRSALPTAFWWFSLGGGAALLTYAVLGIHDLVFAIGQGAGLFIYTRNLFLLRRNRTVTLAD
jgi:lipid-A-disaccharide synthase-like uncharacterized protein